MRKKKKRRIGKVIWSIVGMFVIAAGCLGYYEYHQLQPTTHFKSVPTVQAASVTSSKNTKNTKVKVTVKPLPKVKPPKENTFNVLLLGSDERTGQTVGHSDSIMLVHVDLNNHKYTAVSIPRDTRVYLQGYGYTKLTSVQYIKQATEGSKAGVLAAVDSITRLTGVPINYYVETNYTGLQSIVNTLGTITVNVPFNVRLTHPWYQEDANKVITKGPHTLDGKMVTELVHERYSLKRIDYDRQLLQEKALVGIAKEVMKPKNLAKLPKISKSIDKYVIQTNMTKSDMLSMGFALKGFNPTKDLTYEQLTGQGKVMYDDILQADNDEIVLNPTQVKEKMKAFE